MLHGDVDGQTAMRRANLRRALQLILDAAGEETRAGIARATGLTAATASSLVAELIENRLVVDGARAASTGGKRATTLDVDPGHHLLLVLVLRRADADAALVALDGTAAHREGIAYTPAGRDAAIRDLVERVAERFGPRLLAASVQLPGATDGRIVLESVLLGWKDRPLAEQLEAALQVPVLLVNDVDAEAVAEQIAHRSDAVRRLFLHIGDGIGAAITVDGELTPGAPARVGEIGHVQVVFGDEAVVCRCGQRGCLESAASAPAMLGEDFREGMDPDAFAGLVARADPGRLAHGAVALGRVVQLLGAMLDPDEIVIGGAAAGLGEDFLERVRAETRHAPRGTVAASLRAATPGIGAHVGAAQLALISALGVRWNAERFA